MAINGRLLIAAGLFSIYAGTAAASGLRVTPLRMDFFQNQTSGQIEVSNLGTAPLAVQVKAFRWAQKDGTETYEPTTDIFFAPPIVSVAPQKKTIVRFRLRAAPPLDRENSYRVYFQEVPSATENAPSAGMTFRMRFGVPVFVHPVKPAYPVLSAVSTREADGLRVKLKNTGSAHIRINDVQLYPASVNEKNPDQAVVSHAPQGAHGTNYLLPGSEDEWVLPLAAGASPEGLKLLVRTDDYSGHAAPGITPQGFWWVPGGGGTTPAKKP